MQCATELPLARSDARKANKDKSTIKETGADEAEAGNSDTITTYEHHGAAYRDS
jgi:hypothetical protein